MNTFAETMKKPFAVMAKPVGSKCNMRCSYCYYLGKDEELAGGVARGAGGRPAKGGGRMSDEVLEALIMQTISSSPGPAVSFTWHGGEPMLAGLDFYRKAVAFEKKYLPDGWQVWNSLQTNGLRLNDQWCRFLRDNSFDVGLSIDGCRAVHDRNRRDAGGNGTFDRVRKSVALLNSYGIAPDLLCTVNSASVSDPLSVYRGLRELGSTWIQFIPIVARTDDGVFTDESVTPDEYGNFLCAVFDEWLVRDLGSLDVQLFAELSRVMAGGSASVCWMSPVCGRVIVAEKNGDIYSCDHFVDDGHRLGNLLDTPIDDLVNSTFQIAFGDSKRDALTARCRACQWLTCCGGGCLKDRFAISEDGEEGQYYLCGGMQQFFAHACPKLQQVMDYSRNGFSPARIRSLML